MKSKFDLLGMGGFIENLNFVIRAHHLCPRSPRKAYRQWDLKTPYSIHPIWCAMTLLSETRLTDEQRQRGAIALLYHDLVEDTSVALPNWLSEEVKRLVYDMTFFGGSKEEQVRVWEKSKFIRLLKLYDKVSNLMDGRDTWMKQRVDTDYRQKYEAHARRLLEDVLQNFGELNITLFARKILEVA